MKNTTTMMAAVSSRAIGSSDVMFIHDGLAMVFSHRKDIPLHAEGDTWAIVTLVGFGLDFFQTTQKVPNERGNMFRKDRDLTERSRTLLKNKETKTLKADLLRQFPSVTEDDLNALLPNKVNLTSIKLVDRTILYAVDDVVMFFDLKGRNNLYPSIVAMWKIPHMMKTMVTHGPVSRNLIRGADLMVPGVIQRDATLQGLQDKEKCAVRIYGNPLPFAVGDSCFDFDSIVTARKGKALDILHCYGDLLVPPHSVVLPPGYLKDEILPTESNITKLEQIQYEEDGVRCDSDDEAGDDADGSDGANDADGADPAGDEAEVGNQLEALSMENRDGDADCTTEGGDGQPQDANGDDDGGDATDDPSTVQRTPQEYADDVLHCFVLFVKHVVKDPLLPILVSTMWPMFQRVFNATSTTKAAGQSLAQVMKLSTLPKPVSLLMFCQQAALLSFEEKAPGVYVIRSVQRTHSWLREHKYDGDAETLRQIAAGQLPDHNAVDGDEAEGDGSGGNKVGEKRIKVSAQQLSAASAGSKGGKHMEIVELFKLPRKLQETFRGFYHVADNASEASSEGIFGEHLLRASEVRKMLQLYVRSRALVRQQSVAATEAPAKGAKAGKGSASGGGNVRTVVAVPESDALFELVQAVGEVSLVPRDGATEVVETATVTAAAASGPPVEDAVDAGGEETVSDSQPPAAGDGEAGDAGESADRAAADDDEDRELTDEERAKYLLMLQQASASSSAALSENSALFASVDKFYAQSNAPQMKIAKGGLRPLSDLDDTAAAERKPRVNAMGNTIFSKPVRLPPPPAKKPAAAAVKPADAAKVVPAAAAAKSSSSKKTKTNAPASAPVPSHMQRLVTASWEDVMQQCVAKCTPYHAILAPLHGGQQDEREMMVRSGSVPTVKVLTEKRAGNKTVTIIRNLETLLFSAVGGLDVESITKFAQKKFACSCAVSTVPGMAAHVREIVIQGPFAMDVPSFLQEVVGIPAQYVEVVASKHLSNKKKR